MRAELKSCQFADLLGGALCELRMRVQPGANRGPADGKVIKTVEHLFQSLDIAVQQVRPAAELLSDRERYSVLQVGTPDLDDRVEFFCFRLESGTDRLDRWNQNVLHAFGRRNVHGR